MFRHTNTYCFDNSCAKQKGMTFIEVLVALVIMVTGILGAVAMQATAKKGSFDAMQRSLASSLAQDIVERMRSNDATALANYASKDYGVSLNALPSKRCHTSGGLCTSTEMATNDQYEWELALMGADVKNGTDNAGGLVDARACINVASNAVTVVITWEGRTKMRSDQYTADCSALKGERRQVLLEAFIF
jgi:type IV pilus assembly protein PilV